MDYREDYERARRYRGEGDFREYDRGEHDRRRDERGFLERLADELRAWFRDDDAQRRRTRDDRDDAARWGGGERGWGPDREEAVDRDWARQWGYVDRGEDRPGRSRHERSSGGEGYGSERSSGDRYYEPRSGWGDPSGWGAERGSWSAERGWSSADRGGESGAGPHAGRGPRGYQRSDERIREDVCDRLCEHGYVDASAIEVTVLNGEVTLSGVVPERHEKRMAEDAAEQVSGVREVHNQLRVTPGGSGQEPQGRPGDPRFRIA
jgi:hypothetical protein